MRHRTVHDPGITVETPTTMAGNLYTNCPCTASLAPWRVAGALAVLLLTDIACIGCCTSIAGIDRGRVTFGISPLESVSCVSQHFISK